MAVLEQIRQRTVLVLVMIGLGMFGFLFMDSTQSGISCSPNEEIFIGSIYGEDIGFLEMNQEIIYVESINEKLNGRQASDFKSESFKQAWQNIVETRVIQSACHKLGLTVTSKEQYDIETGRFDIRMLDDNFERIPDTRQGDTVKGLRKQQVDAYITQINSNNIGDGEGQLPEEWKNFYVGLSKSAERNRLKQKYQNLVSIGMPNTVIDREELSAYKNLDIRYVTIDYDFTVDISDKEINEYYDKHSSEYKNDEEKRTVEIVKFPIEASSKDKSNMKDFFDKLSEQFLLNEDDSLFARINSLDIWINQYIGVDHPITQEDENIFELIQQDIGENISYIIDNKCRLSKLTDIKEGGEIEARHILLRVGDTTSEDILTQEQAEEKARIIKQRIQSGEDFGELAIEESDDPGSGKSGGELGWFAEGAMVEEFWNACNTSEVGDLTIVTSQFGVHLINITGKRPTYKVVSIEKTIAPSKQTKDHLYSNIKEFIKLAKSEDQKLDFKSYVENRIEDQDNNLIYESHEINKISYDIAALENSRSIIKWALSVDEEEISNVIYNCGNSYVVANLSNIELEGEQLLENVKEEIKKKIQKDRQFSSSIKKISKDDSIDDIAKVFDVNVETAKFNFLNSENKFDNALVGTANAIEESKISSLFQGEDNMYVLQLVRKTDLSEPIKKVNDSITIEDILKALQNDAEIINLLYNY